MTNLIIFGIGYLVVGILSALMVAVREGAFSRAQDPLDDTNEGYRQMLKESPWTFSEFSGSIIRYIITLILIVIFWPIAILLGSIVGD